MQVAAIYNPQEMQEDLFVERFVVRHETLNELLNPIIETPADQLFQHTIIQGLRGQGKSSLLRKLSISVRDDQNLSQWLIPVLFKEEEYSVTSLCRLWELTGEYLSEHREYENLPDQFEELYQSKHYQQDCFSIIANALQHTNKCVLLLIDNIGEMLAKFDLRDQQRLREILQTQRCIRIIGASAVTLEQHYDQGKPFFQFFKMKSLEGLNSAETHQLLLGLGDAQQTEKMREILQTRAGKIEALRRLTAGVPRTLILLYEIFLDDKGSALDDLEILLDRVTPLYKHRLDDLPAQQQNIVQTIALGWDAMSTKEIASKTRLPSKLVSAQLSQLEKNRIIRRIPTSTKNHLYQLEERFFNIWCLMRLGRKNDKQRAVWLVRFLQTWCNDQELADRAKQHLQSLKEGKLAPRHALLWTQALAECLTDIALQQILIDKTRELVPQIADSLPESDREIIIKAVKIFEDNDFDKCVEILKPLVEKGCPEAIFINGMVFQEKNDIQLAEKYYKKAAKKSYIYAIKALAEIYFNQIKIPKVIKLLRLAVDMGDLESMSKLAMAYAMSGTHPKKALELVMEALRINSDLVNPVVKIGVFLWNNLYLESFSEINEVVKKPLSDEQIKHYFILVINMLVAKSQIAFALKLFEEQQYANLNLKELIKPYYYALLLEANESRSDDALRMGSELQETVAEIREKFESFKSTYATI